MDEEGGDSSLLTVTLDGYTGPIGPDDLAFV